MAGTHSGVGKTTVATGIMAALTRLGARVGAAKVGPDYIDPGYHARATGRPSRNLDAWMCGAATITSVAAKAANGCDVLVVEGVMGLFDGAVSRPTGSSTGDDPGRGMYGSTAHVAGLLGAPVVLVVDASAQSGSVAALVHGFATYDPAVEIAAVVLNRVASDSHETMLRDALGPLGIPVVGVLRRDDAFRWRDRHLGLVPVIEHGPELAVALDRLATAVAAGCDLPGIRAIATRARPQPVEPPPGPRAVPAGRRPRIAVAAGPAFSFNYPDNLEALESAGAELIPFDPVEDMTLPAGVGGLVAGGGFPEVFAEGLAANGSLLADTSRRVGAGLVTWAECGGLLWLATSLDGRPMAGALPCTGTMTDRLTLGYRTARLRVPSPIGPAGSVLRGHEFHYSTVEPAGTSLALEGRTGASSGGFAGPTLFASYLHQHLAGAPQIAERFVAGCVPS